MSGSSDSQPAPHDWDASGTLWNPVTMSSYAQEQANDGIYSKPLRIRGQGRGRSICQVPGCTESLLDCKPYFKRHLVCQTHAVLPVVAFDGVEMRFCQQCAKFERRVAFDAGNRSCRLRLFRRNAAKHRSQVTKRSTQAPDAQEPSPGLQLSNTPKPSRVLASLDVRRPDSGEDGGVPGQPQQPQLTRSPSQKQERSGGSSAELDTCCWDAEPAPSHHWNGVSGKDWRNQATSGPTKRKKLAESAAAVSNHATLTKAQALAKEDARDVEDNGAAEVVTGRQQTGKRRQSTLPPGSWDESNSDNRTLPSHGSSDANDDIVGGALAPLTSGLRLYGHSEGNEPSANKAGGVPGAELPSMCMSIASVARSDSPLLPPQQLQQREQPLKQHQQSCVDTWDVTKSRVASLPPRSSSRVLHGVQCTDAMGLYDSMSAILTEPAQRSGVGADVSTSSAIDDIAANRRLREVMAITPGSSGARMVATDTHMQDGSVAPDVPLALQVLSNRQGLTQVECQAIGSLLGLAPVPAIALRSLSVSNSISLDEQLHDILSGVMQEGGGDGGWFRGPMGAASAGASGTGMTVAGKDSVAAACAYLDMAYMAGQEEQRKVLALQDFSDNRRSPLDGLGAMAGTLQGWDSNVAAGQTIGELGGNSGVTNVPRAGSGSAASPSPVIGGRAGDGMWMQQQQQQPTTEQQLQELQQHQLTLQQQLDELQHLKLTLLQQQIEEQQEIQQQLQQQTQQQQQQHQPNHHHFTAPRIAPGPGPGPGSVTSVFSGVPSSRGAGWDVGRVAMAGPAAGVSPPSFHHPPGLLSNSQRHPLHPHLAPHHARQPNPPQQQHQSQRLSPPQQQHQYNQPLALRPTGSSSELGPEISHVSASVPARHAEQGIAYAQQPPLLHPQAPAGATLHVPYSSQASAVLQPAFDPQPRSVGLQKPPRTGSADWLASAWGNTSLVGRGAAAMGGGNCASYHRLYPGRLVGSDGSNRDSPAAAGTSACNINGTYGVLATSDFTESRWGDDVYYSPSDTVRLSIKMTDCNPYDMDPTSTQEIMHQIASLGGPRAVLPPLASVRPGCVHIILNATYSTHTSAALAAAEEGLVTSHAAEGGLVTSHAAYLDRGWTQPAGPQPDVLEAHSAQVLAAVRRLAALNKTAVVVQAGSQVMTVDRTGQQVTSLHVDKAAAAGGAPSATAVPPVLKCASLAAAHLGVRGCFQLYGSGLSVPGAVFWGRMHGVHYELQVQCINDDSCALIQLPVLTRCGLMVVEVEVAGTAPGVDAGGGSVGLASPSSSPCPRPSLLSEWIAMVVVPSVTVATEINGLQGRLPHESLQKLLVDLGSLLDVMPVLSQPVNGLCPVLGQRNTEHSSRGSKTTWRSSSVELEEAPGSEVVVGGVVACGNGGVRASSDASASSCCGPPATEAGTSYAGTCSTFASSRSGPPCQSSSSPTGSLNICCSMTEALTPIGTTVSTVTRGTAPSGALMMHPGCSGAVDAATRGVVTGGVKMSEHSISPIMDRALGDGGGATGVRRLLHRFDPSDLLTNGDDETVVQLLLGPQAVRLLLARAVSITTFFTQRHMVDSALCALSAVSELHYAYPDLLRADMAPLPKRGSPCLMHAAVRSRSLALMLAAATCGAVLGNNVSLAWPGPGGIAPLHLVALLGQPYILTGLQFVVPEVREMWYTLRDSTYLTPSELRTMTQLPPSYVRPYDLRSPSVVGDTQAPPASDNRTQKLSVVHEESASPTLTPQQLLSARCSLGATNAVSGQGRDAMFTPLPSPSVSCNFPVATAVVPLSQPPSPLQDGPASSLPTSSCPDWGKLPTVIACRDAEDNLCESEITERLSASREGRHCEMVEDAVADMARLSVSMNPSPTSDLPRGGIVSKPLCLGIGAPSALPPPPQQQYEAADGGRANKGGVSILSCLAMNFTRRLMPWK